MSAKLNRWFLLVFALLLVAGIGVTSAAIAEGIKQKHQILCVNPFMQNVKGVSLNLNDAISAKDNKTFRQAMSGAMTYFNYLIEVTPQSVYWAYPGHSGLPSSLGVHPIHIPESDRLPK